MASRPHGHAFAQEFPALADALGGQFQVERELGRGVMDVVYLARDERLERMVALEVLPAALAAEPRTRERFLREARTAARPAHPNVVPVHQAGEAGGSACFAMAYVDGESLAERGARRTLVTDFGIAHHTTTEPSARLTQDRHVLGALHVMSPEQVNGDALDGRSDLRALGVVAHHVLSGRLPFEGLAAAAVLVAHATSPALPLRQVALDVPGALASVVDRCLAKAPGDRFPTGEALAEALPEALEETLERTQAGGPEAQDVLPPTPGPPARLEGAQAAAVWRRAAQLQADALRRQGMTAAAVERLGAGRGKPAPDADTGAEGYRIAEVAAAAEEAGIAWQSMAPALAELPHAARPRRGSPAGARRAPAP